VNDTFAALVARQSESGYAVALEALRTADLPSDGVLIEVDYSSLNYKDALAVTGRGRIIRRFPMVPGIDLAGTVIEAPSGEYQPGDRVLAVGQGLGETEWGGYSRRQRVRADALVPIPASLSTEEAMRIGTAGFTAMLCVLALEHQEIDKGREVVVTGATGGVGSVAVHLLARRGYEVVASSGRPELESYLRSLGAATIVPREELAKKGGPLQPERWGGGVDTVGGDTLANLYAQTAYEGAIACCGMAGGHELPITVWPLILRNISLLGISSVRTPRPKRIEAWTRLAAELDRDLLATTSRTEPLTRIEELATELLDGRLHGRVVIDTQQ
jgi:acrylyl-CoA reductase (NADPH)